MKKKNIFIIIVFIITCIGLSFIIFTRYNSKKKVDNSNEVKQAKGVYYKEMKEKMFAYYKIMFKYLNIPDELKASPIRIELGTLKKEGFPMDEFVSYDKKETCDLTDSYALAKIEDGKNIMYVYYKCGEDANYNVKEKSNKEETTTKKVANE